MAVPAHKTEYFIIEKSNLQKKANTADFFKIQQRNTSPITDTEQCTTMKKTNRVGGYSLVE